MTGEGSKKQRNKESKRGRVGERKRRREDLSLPGWIVLLACGDTVELRGWSECVEHELCGWCECVVNGKKEKGIEEPNASIPFSTMSQQY